MKKFVSVFLCIVIIMSCVSVGASAVNTAPVYYIDSISGDDANEGNSPEKAWKTINNHSYEFVPGTKVLFRSDGAYELTDVILIVEGTKENPIVISSYGEGERPLLYAKGRNEVFTFIDSSFVTISDVQITAPDGGGIWITTSGKLSRGFVIENVKFFDIQNYHIECRDDLSNGPATGRTCIMIKGFPSGSPYPVNDVTIRGCEMTDCANGISAWGMARTDPGVTAEYDAVFNEGLLIEDCYFADMDAEAIIVGINNGAVVRNCVSTRCCLGGTEPAPDGGVTYFTAAMWFWGSVNSVIEHCEISDQKNYGDGMTVDFDSFTNYCTYQYVYSHDNVRFMVNNAKFATQRGNTVRYCLSVNDGVGSNRMASGAGEDSFSFYNNTIVNCGFFDFSRLTNSLIANNIIIPKYGYKLYCDTDYISGRGNNYTNNCYYNAVNPYCDFMAMNELPAFVGEDYTNSESFKLAKNSPLIGAGTKINDGLKKDFFGEDIVSNNIGCYGGTGVDTEGKTSNAVDEIINFFRVLWELLVREIKIGIEEMSRR